MVFNVFSLVFSAYSVQDGPKYVGISMSFPVDNHMSK